MLFIFLIFLITFVHCDEIFAVKRDILPSDAKQLENDENADAKKSNDNVSYDEYPVSYFPSFLEINNLKYIALRILELKKHFKPKTKTEILFERKQKNLSGSRLFTNFN